ncbi:GNAT family N-acetyltransferase [Alteribacter aurantiacus]|uniref:GNAT family N-acetyltransferase n=1 Tax=Alteribacter aurantiacus TaxID=254410 RepID=UPI0003F66A06|nr:GNAT family N-acetyltransferase [Alteribacter aurantiacus]
MQIEFRKLDDDLNDLVELHTSNTWPFHGDPRPSKLDIHKRFHGKWYEDDRETFWVLLQGEKVGIIIIGDISDTIPMLYDIRLCESVRGKGIGKKCVSWIVDYVFKGSEKRIRIETYTRHDNYGMRKVFSKCNFQKEGYLRDSWENEDGTIGDSLVYGITRRDWERGEKTPIKLNDVPF